MAKLPVRALLIDCDGTLAPMRMEVTPAVRRSVTSLARTIPVGIISSRDHLDIGRLASSLGFTAPQVSEGGARIFRASDPEPLWIRTIAPPEARAIVEFLAGSGHTFTAVDGGRRVTAASDISDWDMTRITADSLSPDQARSITSGFAESLAGVHTEIVVRTDNGDWMVDFTHSEATKATAAGEFARLVGVPLAQIAGVGDGYNDLPLLRACGTAVAMGQAPGPVREAADHVAPSAWDDGLAAAIDEFIVPGMA